MKLSVTLVQLLGLYRKIRMNIKNCSFGEQEIPL